jgi:Fur family zinc uptake transcriptional regulator
MDQQLFVSEAERICASHGGKMTALRRQVLELVVQYSGVVKAYQILSDLQKQRGGAAAPPTVYRALDFWVELGVLHRVEALNGFVRCSHFGCQHECLFLVCEQCGDVEELDAAPGFSALSAAIMPLGFTLRRQNMVLTGTCRQCLQ